jgi:hypothetical protein
MKFDFRYPRGLIGFHSGWSNNDSPTHRLSLTKRINVKLKHWHYTPKIILEKKDLPPFMIKNKEGNIKGLSSGVGSTLIKHKSRVFKIKRSGFKYDGFLKNKIFDRNFEIKRGLYEETEFEVGGCLSMIDAKREILMEKELRKAGFLIPQKTVALYKVATPFHKEDAVALIQEIKSDFRIDEFVMVLLCNLFYDIFKDKIRIRINEQDVIFPNYSLKRGLNLLNKKYRKIFYLIGRSIGAIYRKLHDKGFIRGISNSWYGNEVLLEDGNIGLCDLESSFHKEEILFEDVFMELCKTDINLAVTAFYDSMNFFENSIASFVGCILIDGFKEGYKTREYSKLDKKIIVENIDKFFKIKKKIIEDG